MNRNLEKPGQRIKPVPAFSEYRLFVKSWGKCIFEAQE